MLDSLQWSTSDKHDQRCLCFCWRKVNKVTIHPMANHFHGCWLDMALAKWLWLRARVGANRRWTLRTICYLAGRACSMLIQAIQRIEAYPAKATLMPYLLGGRWASLSVWLSFARKFNANCCSCAFRIQMHSPTSCTSHIALVLLVRSRHAYPTSKYLGWLSWLALLKKNIMGKSKHQKIHRKQKIQRSNLMASLVQPWNIRQEWPF